MVLQDLDYIFDTLDLDDKGYIEWIELQEFDESIYHEALDIEQLDAAIRTVCGESSDGKCTKEYFSDLSHELERRHHAEEQVRWDFRALDRNDIGRIPIESALFLFKVAHGDRFSKRTWTTFLENRLHPQNNVSLDEIKIPLCNIPDFAAPDSEKDYVDQKDAVSQKTGQQLYNRYQELIKLQEDDPLAAIEREKQTRCERVKNRAEYLLDRIDEIGVEALLEDDDESLGYEGRAKERVLANDLLNALKEKYEVLRDKLLWEMLALHIGRETWQSFSEYEQREKLFQLKMQEEKLRKERQLERMAAHLPGARLPRKYNLFGAIGESLTELNQRIKVQEEQVNDTGLSMEEVEKEFSEKLAEKELLNSTTEAVIIAINDRYIADHTLLKNRIQGLNGETILESGDREKLLFGLVMARSRGIQEPDLYTSAVSMGLSERIEPRKYDRSHLDEKKHTILSAIRLKAFKKRRSYEDPIGPPKFFPLKTKMGRLDVLLQLAQEMEYKFALERDAFMGFLYSRDFAVLKEKVKELSTEQRLTQLAQLRNQWEGYCTKDASEKLSTHNRQCLHEALAIRHMLLSAETNTLDEGKLATMLLVQLQVYQNKHCRMVINVGEKSNDELKVLWKEETRAIVEENFTSIAGVVFGISETSNDEDDIVNALENKYDALRDKLLLDSLMNQHGKAEWDKLTEQQRQNELARLRLLEKKLRREGKYDELAKLLGDAAQNSNLLNSLLGQSRQKYLDRLNERLKNREQQIIDGGGDLPVEDGEEDESEMSTGNLLRDLDRRFDDEKDALLRRLRDENDANARERERQCELARLKLEARKAAKETTLGGAALVLGLAERNKAALEDRLKSDRARQEQLARERLAARKKKTLDTEPSEEKEPGDDDVFGWKDYLLKELERKHEKEQWLLSNMLQDIETEELRKESRDLTAEERNQRINKLKTKRDALDFQQKGDQDEHVSLLEMAVAVKYVTKEVALKETSEEVVANENVVVSIMADLQQLQDTETSSLLDSLPDKSVSELKELCVEYQRGRLSGQVENVAALVFTYEGDATDQVLVDALDKKYDVLMDKLALEALQKQLGDAEWAKLSEKARQAKLARLRLEQKRLLKEGKLDEAAKLLGDGFKADADLQKLMGENKKKFNERLQQRLKERREKVARGEDVDDLEDEMIIEEDVNNDIEAPTDAKSLLEDLQKRYDDEKDALLVRLHGSDARYLNEKERQAELTRLNREQRRARQEEKFGTAAMVLGLAERNQAALTEKLKSDRERQERLAKDRLEKLRNRKRSSQMNVTTDDVGQDSLLSLMENRHVLEQEDLVSLLQNKDPRKLDECRLFKMEERRNKTDELKALSSHDGQFQPAIEQLMYLKYINRTASLQTNQDDVVDDDCVTVSILADLQQKQDAESEEFMKMLAAMDDAGQTESRDNEIMLRDSKHFPNLVFVLSLHETEDLNDNDVLLGVLEDKYEALKDKLILEALERQIDNWADLSEEEKQNELMKVKLEHKRLMDEGKHEEAERFLADLLDQEKNVQSLLGDSSEEERMKARFALRKQRLADGMSEEEIRDLEAEEDAKLLKEVESAPKGKVLVDLEKNFEVEKAALLSMLASSDSKRVAERARQLELARLRREAKKARAEEKFDAAALVLGMAKSQQAALNAKMNSDRARQEQLARERLQARRNKRLSKVEQTLALETNDLLTLQQDLMGELEKTHVQERDALIGLIDTIDDSEYKKPCTALEPAQQNARLKELKELYSLWHDYNDNPESGAEIFQEAFQLKVLGEEPGTEVAVKYLANLQDEQDREAECILRELVDKDVATLKTLIEAQQRCRHDNRNNNIATIFFTEKASLDNTTNELLEALTEKYDAMKDKVFEEALRNQYSDEDWNELSEEEKRKLVAQTKTDESFENNLESIHLSSVMNEAESNGTEVIKDLQEQFETEKNALLQLLQNVDSKGLNERDRQLALARLRREKKLIKREEKYNGAALLLNLATQNKAKSQQSYENERVRQEQLARERIQARRQQQKTQVTVQQSEHVDREDDLATVERIQREGTVAMQESLLQEVEKKHATERDILMTLFEGANSMPQNTRDSDSRRLQLIYLSHNKLKNKSRSYLSSQNDSDFSNEAAEKSYHDTLQRFQDDVVKLLSEALLHHLAVNGGDGDESCVRYLADLQAEQLRESNALMTVLKEAERNTIKSLKAEQRKARRAGWHDNIATLLFKTKAKEEEVQSSIVEETSLIATTAEEMDDEFQKEEAELIESTNAQLAELEHEIEQTKQEKLSAMSENEIEGFIKELNAQEASKRAAIEEQATRQREAARARLAEKRRKREEKNYESDLASAMLVNAQKRGVMMREKTMAAQGAQKDELEERLKRRREERQRRENEAVQREQDAALEAEAARQKAEAEKASQAEEYSNANQANDESVHGDDVNALGTVEEPGTEVPSGETSDVTPVADGTSELPAVVKKKKKPPLPGGGMRREKTVVEQAAEISEHKKKHMINVLLREQTSIAKKINKEQTRQEDMVKALREKRRKKMEAREMEAAAVIGLGVRQKTIVEDRQKGERERQIENIRERVNRLKNERRSKVPEAASEENDGGKEAKGSGEE